MASMWQLLFTLVLLPLCSPLPPRQQRAPSFSNALSFTRKMRTRVQNLLLQYKGEQLGDEQFEDRSLALQTLPSTAIEYNLWLQMQDWERLNQARQDLQTFWTHLDIKHRQLEAEKKKKQGGTQGLKLRGRSAPTLIQAMSSVQMDLRDLIQQVETQLLWLNSTSGPSASPDPSLETSLDPALGQAPWNPAHNAPLLPSLQLWSSRLQGYVILRDLNCYLGKLARDFTLLGSKQHS